MRKKQSKNLRDLWGNPSVACENHQKETSKDQKILGKKLEPLPAPLRSGRVVSYEKFCQATSSRHNPDLGTPTFVDQWFSLIYDHGESGVVFSWTWLNKPEILNSFESYEEVPADFSSEKIPSSLLEGDELCQLLGVMDHLDADEPSSKRKPTIFSTDIIITDQSNERKHKVTAQTNYISSCMLPCLSESIPKQGKSSLISILKSSLQKNVRRCRPDSAVRVAFKLMKLEGSFSQFVRRLCIIVLEDAVLHPAYPAIVWMMMTSIHGYSVPIEAINLLLQITWEVAATSFRDPLPLNKELEIPSFEELYDTFGDEKTEEICLIRSLLTRGAYGGMSCDIKMMQQYASIWMGRFQFPLLNHLPDLSLDDNGAMPQYLNTTNPLSIWKEFINKLYGLKNQNLIDYRNLDPLTAVDIPLASIDFHCTSIVEILNLEQIEDVLKEDDLMFRVRTEMQNICDLQMDNDEVIKKVKSLMWQHRSSYSVKRTLFPSEPEIPSSQDGQMKDLFVSLEKKFDRYSQLRIQSLRI